MGDILDKAKSVFRDYALDGVLGSGLHEPRKAEVRSLFGMVETAVYAAQAGYAIVADLTARDAYFAVEENRSRLVYVNNENGDPADPANGVYEYVGGAPRLAEGVSQGLVAIVQPLVDLAEAAAADLQDNLTVIDPVNIYNPATMRIDGKFIATNNTIADDPAWAYARIPVTPGQSYAWASDTERRVGATFLAADFSPVGGAYIGTATGAGASTSAIAPATAAWLAINVKSNSIAEPAETMVNIGGTALPYSPWAAPANFVRASRVVSDAPSPLAYVENRASLNLYDPSQRRERYYVANTGAISVEADWSCTGFIPVTPGQQVTISTDAPRRQGLAFYTARASDSYVSGSYNASSDNPLTVTVPVGAAFLVANLSSSAISPPAEVMINVGGEALAYEPFGNRELIRRDAIWPSLETGSGARLVIATAGQAELHHKLGGGSFVHRFSPFLPASHAAGSLWNFHDYRLDGVDQSVNATDDIAPYRVGGRTVGANHGNPSTLCTAIGHGKTLADVGSVYAEGGVEWVVVDVPSADQIRVTRRTGLSYYTGTTLTHVSGGTNTGSFAPSVKTNGDFFPAHKNRRLSLHVDGARVEAVDATYYPQRGFAFGESYDVLNKDSLVEWLIAQAGTPTDIADYDGDADFSVSHSYAFDNDGGCAIATDFLALQDVPTFQDIMFAQAYRMAATGGVLKYLIPDTAPFSFEGDNYDFTAPVDMTAWAPATRLDITPDRIADPLIWPDRVIQINGSLGMAIGYLPIRDADPAVRPTRAARKAMQISEIGKIYLSAIDSASRTALATGDHFGVVAYRAFFAPHPDRTASYVVRGPDADWLYVDWHQSIFDRVDLPADLHGRAFTVHRTSTGVTAHGTAATDSVSFSVATSAGAGRYAILRFAR